MDDLLRAMLMLGGQFETWQNGHESSCVMVSLPNELSDRITDFSVYAVPEMELYRDDSQNIHGREFDTHITVKYGLKTNNPLDVLHVIDTQSIAPFPVVLGKAGLFEKDLYDVVMIEVESAGLGMLHDALKANLPNDEIYPVYHPHVTVAYVQHGMGRAHVGATDFAGLTFTVDRVLFQPTVGPSKTIPLYGVML